MAIPFHRPSRVTHRQVQGKAKAAEQAAALGLQAIGQIGTEWRTFAEMGLGARVWWLLTGCGPHVAVSHQRSEEFHAEVSEHARQERDAEPRD